MAGDEVPEAGSADPCRPGKEPGCPCTCAVQVRRAFLSERRDRWTEVLKRHWAAAGGEEASWQAVAAGSVGS